MKIGILSRNPDTAIQDLRSTGLIEFSGLCDEKSLYVCNTQTIITPSEFFSFMSDHDIFLAVIGNEVTFDTSSEEYDETAFKQMITQKHRILWGGTRNPQVIPFG